MCDARVLQAPSSQSPLQSRSPQRPAGMQQYGASSSLPPISETAHHKFLSDGTDGGSSGADRQPTSSHQDGSSIGNAMIMAMGSSEFKPMQAVGSSVSQLCMLHPVRIGFEALDMG